MIGIIPSASKTYEVMGDFNTPDKQEGKLYYHPSTKRLYFYSTAETRSNPATGYFPVWDGNVTYVSNFSKEKYLSDATMMDIESLSSNITKETADAVRYNQRRSDNDEILVPTLSDGDNMFTQCIKGVILAKKVSMIDLVDMTSPKLPQKTVENYYSALNKITFMRLDKWNIWLDTILHIHYVLEVYKNGKRLLQYQHPIGKFDTGIVSYNDIATSDADPFKKIIKILMIMENITKNDLRSDDVDDYTINNMMTTLNGNKALSAQLFSRFIRMAKLSYNVRIYDNGDETLLFEYNE